MVKTPTYTESQMRKILTSDQYDRWRSWTPAKQRLYLDRLRQRRESERKPAKARLKTWAEKRERFTESPEAWRQARKLGYSREEWRDMPWRNRSSVLIFNRKAKGNKEYLKHAANARRVSWREARAKLAGATKKRHLRIERGELTKEERAKPGVVSLSKREISDYAMLKRMVKEDIKFMQENYERKLADAEGSIDGAISRIEKVKSKAREVTKGISATMEYVSSEFKSAGILDIPHIVLTVAPKALKQFGKHLKNVTSVAKDASKTADYSVKTINSVRNSVRSAVSSIDKFLGKTGEIIQKKQVEERKKLSDARKWLAKPPKVKYAKKLERDNRPLGKKLARFHSDINNIIRGFDATRDTGVALEELGRAITSSVHGIKDMSESDFGKLNLKIERLGRKVGFALPSLTKENIVEMTPVFTKMGKNFTQAGSSMQTLGITAIEPLQELQGGVAKIHEIAGVINNVIDIGKAGIEAFEVARDDLSERLGIKSAAKAGIEAYKMIAGKEKLPKVEPSKKKEKRLRSRFIQRISGMSITALQQEIKRMEKRLKQKMPADVRRYGLKRQEQRRDMLKKKKAVESKRGYMANMPSVQKEHSIPANFDYIRRWQVMNPKTGKKEWRYEYAD